MNILMIKKESSLIPSHFYLTETIRFCFVHSVRKLSWRLNYHDIMLMPPDVVLILPGDCEKLSHSYGTQTQNLIFSPKQASRHPQIIYGRELHNLLGLSIGRRNAGNRSSTAIISTATHYQIHVGKLINFVFKF